MTTPQEASPHADDEPRPLAESVYNQLLTLLITSDIEPDSRLTIDAIARQFGVSPTPVREALGRLEQDGLVWRQLMPDTASHPC
jgi:DNA-binding GntR family transcriptional regulator